MGSSGCLCSYICIEILGIGIYTLLSYTTSYTFSIFLARTVIRESSNNGFTFASDEEMLACFDDLHIISNPNLPSGQWHNHHAQAWILAAFINDPIFSQRRQWLVRICLSSFRIHVWKFAARSAARHMDVEGGFRRRGRW
jgi:hypothetical protein